MSLLSVVLFLKQMDMHFSKKQYLDSWECSPQQKSTTIFRNFLINTTVLTSPFHTLMDPHYNSKIGNQDTQRKTRLRVHPLKTEGGNRAYLISRSMKIIIMSLLTSTIVLIIPRMSYFQKVILISRTQKLRQLKIKFEPFLINVVKIIFLKYCDR